jgi:hypothetical protein
LRRSEILASQRSKHQSQTGEVLSDVGQNESKIKRNNFQRVLINSAASQGLNRVEYVFSEVFDLKPTSGLSTRKTG